MISTVIAKPTKACNADCMFCCAPVDGVKPWTVEDFKRILDKTSDHLSTNVVWVWHGGEPSLMGPQFFWECAEYAKIHHPGLRFAIQTNLLSYTSTVWFELYRDVFDGRVSTSFDPGPSMRTLKGSASRYATQFFKALNRCLSDGFRPMVIGTYTDATENYADDIYDRSLSYGESGFDLRFNYRYPAGRVSGQGALMTPKNYGGMLIRLFHKWLRDNPRFSITPLDQMLRKVVGLESGRCPWTNKCGGRFLGIEPNGNVYNCSEFADLADEEFCYGNIFSENDFVDLLNSPPARSIKRRRYQLPMDCQSCRQFDVCEGGCMRDAILYNRGLGGKFYYCDSWFMVFDAIRESIKDGTAGVLLESYGVDIDTARSRLDVHNSDQVSNPTEYPLILNGAKTLDKIKGSELWQ